MFSLLSLRMNNLISIQSSLTTDTVVPSCLLIPSHQPAGRAAHLHNSQYRGIRQGWPCGCGYPHQLPHYPTISRYIRHMSDNADIRIDAYRQIYPHGHPQSFSPPYDQLSMSIVVSHHDYHISIAVIITIIKIEIITIILPREISSSQEEEGVVCHKVAPLVFITQSNPVSSP